MGANELPRQRLDTVSISDLFEISDNGRPRMLYEANVYSPPDRGHAFEENARLSDSVLFPLVILRTGGLFSNVSYQWDAAHLKSRALRGGRSIGFFICSNYR